MTKIVSKEELTSVLPMSVAPSVGSLGRDECTLAWASCGGPFQGRCSDLSSWRAVPSLCHGGNVISGETFAPPARVQLEPFHSQPLETIAHQRSWNNQVCSFISSLSIIPISTPASLGGTLTPQTSGKCSGSQSCLSPRFSFSASLRIKILHPKQLSKSCLVLTGLNNLPRKRSQQ